MRFSLLHIFMLLQSITNKDVNMLLYNNLFSEISSPKDAITDPLEALKNRVGYTLSSEKLGGRNLKIGLVNHVFETKMDEFY